ncbi:MAG: phosphotransferase family protein [Acidimicrobiales bacterium]
MTPVATHPAPQWVADRLDLVADALLETSPILESTVVTSKPARSLVSLRLGGPRPVTVLAKVYADLAQAVRVGGVMAELFDALVGEADLGVPRVMALVLPAGAVVYLPVEGISLSDLGRTGSEIGPAAGPGADPVGATDRRNAANFEAGVAQAGRWLAAVHRTRPGADRTLDLSHEVANAVSWTELVDRELGPAGTRAAALGRALAGDRRLSGGSERMTSLIHKDFHPDHVLVRGTAVSVIDLDECRWGEPAYDLAHFRLSCDLLGLRGAWPPARASAAWETMLGSYTRACGWDDHQRLGPLRGLIAAKLARQIAQGRGPGPRPGSRSDQITQAAAVVDWGLEALA